MSRVNSLGRFMVVLGLICLAACGEELASSSDDAAQKCFESNGQRFNQVLACYRAAEASQPLSYTKKDVIQLAGVQKQSFGLTSQNWSQNGMVQPSDWKHDIDIYIPPDALSGRALIVVNNGLNVSSNNSGIKPASDFTEAMSIAIARQTKTIVVSISNVPNQYLTYLDDGMARREDGSVAHSWKLFMESPKTRPFISLHVPMMEVIVKTIADAL